MSRKPTEQQQAVIDNQSGTVIVKACPGSGKTSTLVERCRALPSAETKLVMAFNKKAAEEFAHRMGSVPSSDVRTFHSFCFREVMRNPWLFGYKSKPTLSNDSLFRQLCDANPTTVDQVKAERGGVEGWDDMPWDEDWLKAAEHSRYDADLEHVMKNDKDEVRRITARDLLRYRNWMLDKNVITFDAMIRLVAEHRDKLNMPAKHVMVDEYQDVDRFQFDIAKTMGCIEGVKSLAVVGDPNQRIYEWRGALGDAFAEMGTAFPAATILPMTVNFRSHDEILEYAEKICSVGMRGVRGPGGEHVVKHGGWREITEGDTAQAAILCRYNRECAMWQIDLARSGVPVYLMGKGDFWAMKHVQLATAAYYRGQTFQALLTSKEWLKMADAKKYRQNPDRLEEVTDDAKFIMSLSKADMKILRDCMQAEGGVRISTIHKTKGMEFDRVMISGVNEKLKQERFVYYVAATRAKNKMILA
jgi:DNA helicase-2/ATP-dependent DNA helicase PcrA